jgi:hypothetical protein
MAHGPETTVELDRLVNKLRADLREWTDTQHHDPGIALVELLAYIGDTISSYAERIANESYLGGSGRRASRLRVAVDGEPWREVASLAESGPEDRHYVVNVCDDGATLIEFGDGVHGRRPPDGGSVRVRYRTGRHYTSVQMQRGRVILDQD